MVKKAHPETTNKRPLPERKAAWFFIVGWNLLQLSLLPVEIPVTGAQ